MADAVLSDDEAQVSSDSESESESKDGDETECFVDSSSQYYDYMPDNVKGKKYKIHGNASMDKFAKVELTSVSVDIKSDCYNGAVYEAEGKVPMKLSMNNGVVHAQSIIVHPDTGFTYILDLKWIRIQVFDPFLNYAWTIPLNHFSKWLAEVAAPDTFCFFRNYICVIGSYVNFFLLYFLTQSGEPVTKFRVFLTYDYMVDNIFSFEDYFYIPFYRYGTLDGKDADKNFSLQSIFAKHTLYLQYISEMEVCEVILSKEFWPFCSKSYSGARFQGRDFYIAAYYYDSVNLNTVTYILKFSIDTLELVASVPLEIGLVSHFSTAGFLLDPTSDSFWFCDIDTNRILIFRKTGELIIGLERENFSKKDNYNHRAAPLAINTLSSKLIVSFSDGENYFQLIDLETLRQEISANI